MIRTYVRLYNRPIKSDRSPIERPAGAHAGCEVYMILLFILMVALCVADLISDRFIELFKRLSQPRVRLARARRYRFV